MHIQQRRRGSMMSLGKGGDGATPFPADDAVVGHSSVEDAAAALRLYRHRSVEWEQSLGYPLRTERDDARRGRRRPPLRITSTGATSPSGAGVSTSAPTTATTTTGGDDPGDGSGVERDDGNYKDLRIATTIPSADFRLTSRVRSIGDNRRHPSNSVISAIDWVQIFRSAPSSP